MSVNATDNGFINATGRGDLAKKCFGDLCKGQCGISDDDMRIGDFSKMPVGEESSGSSGPARLEYPIPGDKGQIVRAGIFNACQAYDGGLWRAYKFSADDAVDL